MKAATPQNISMVTNIIETSKWDEVINTLKQHKLIEFGIDYVKATTLFTGGHVETVRNPGAFDPSKVEPWTDLAGSGPVLTMMIRQMPVMFEDPPQADDYKKAKFLMEYLANAEMPEMFRSRGRGVLKRGLNSLSPNIFLDLCKPGEVYSIGKIASTSTNQTNAMKFASDKKGTRYRLLYFLENLDFKGTPIIKASSYPSEQEVIIGGNIKINSFAFAPIYRGLPKEIKEKYPPAIKDFQQLIGFVEDVENSGLMSDDEVGVAYVYGEIV